MNYTQFPDPKIIAFAIEVHAKTNHLYDGNSYAVHLAMAVSWGIKFIDLIPDEHKQKVLSAIYLHDTIEDCRLNYNDILDVAGVEVAEMVYAVTNEKGRNRFARTNDEYYKGILETPNAVFVKLCDRLANVEYSLNRRQYSKMYGRYVLENERFLEKLFPNENFRNLEPMVTQLKNLLIHRF